LQPLISPAIHPMGWLLFGGLLVLVPLLWFIIGILLCVWVYRDAQKRGMSGILWLIIVLIGGLLGLIIYLIVRKDEKMAPAAPQPPAAVIK